MALLPSRTQTFAISRWILLPLRLFLGITFIYAGIQKLTDPQFFAPSAPGYIGKQILAFAKGSPLHGFLIAFAVPHASLFGYIVACGELAIGLGVLVGFLLRPAAFFGLLISLLFFLSATWRVYPYFYGSDIVFVFCWLTLLLAGPLHTGYPSVDEVTFSHLLKSMPTRHRAGYAPVFSFLLGVREQQPMIEDIPVSNQQQRGRQGTGNRNIRQQSKYELAMRVREQRRNFLYGLVTGGVGMLALAWVWNIVHTGPSVSTPVAPPSSGGTTPGTAGTGTPTTGGVIAQANQVQNNSAVNFTLASNGDPGVLVRLNNGQFVAYDAVCTHAGCPVNYDPSSQLLVCPCHGAEFDPAKQAAAVQGPTNTPLTKVNINVDNATGAITVQG